jgi:uncharacterized protein YegL
VEKQRINHAASELIGVCILLVIVTSVMMMIFFQIESDKGPNKQTYVKLVGAVEGTNLVLEHEGGEPLSTDASISFTVAGKKENYTFSDCLIDDNNNGFWDLGEKMVFPFKYDLNNLSKYNTIDVLSVDKESNSIQLWGSIPLHPIVDLGVTTTVSSTHPHRNDYINVTVTLTCYGGDINGSANIKIRYSIPQGLQFISSSPEIGTYSNSTGLWSIDQIVGKKSVTLKIKLRVVGEGFREFTQFALVLDGSGSIVSGDWNLMRSGLKKALDNTSVFPRDKSVELTVIQFGGSSPPHAVIVLPPTIVNNISASPGYYLTISNKIKTLSQLGGYTPMGCGIRLATDQLHNVGNYSPAARQIILMVTDGLANCNWIAGTYNGQYKTSAIGKTTTEQADAYMISTLGMDSGKDEFDTLAVVGGSQPPDIAWLNGTIVFPQPGHIAPPYVKNSGWVSKVTTWQDFSARISEIFRILFQSIPLKAEISASLTEDPNSLNNAAQLLIEPEK